jgi:hypothetical protein
MKVKDLIKKLSALSDEQKEWPIIYHEEGYGYQEIQSVDIEKRQLDYDHTGMCEHGGEGFEWQDVVELV